MTDNVVIGEKEYVSSKRASEVTGYSQDYIGQLARGGKIDAQRVGGLWYVSMAALKTYQEQADSYKPSPPLQGASQSPETIVLFDGKEYVAASRASEITGYHSDYVSQLARTGSVASRQVGNRWYVGKTDILAHKREKDSLLAAVQAQSVGLKRPDVSHSAQPGNLANTSYNGAGPFLSYVSDTGDLLPVLSRGESEEEEPIHENFSEEKHTVPIRVVETHVYERALPEPLDIREEQTPENIERTAPFRPGFVALSATLGTIVVVLAVSTPSLLRQNSHFTAISGERSLALSSKASQALQRAGDTLEYFLSGELVYQRSE